MDRRLRLFGSAGICFAAVLRLGWGGSASLAGQQRASLAPTPLEAFAAQPDAKTVWSRVIGRLDEVEQRTRS